MFFAPKPGTIGWVDLTVRDADAARDFCGAAGGWAPSPVPLGGDDDYAMEVAAGTGDPAVASDSRRPYRFSRLAGPPYGSWSRFSIHARSRTMPN